VRCGVQLAPPPGGDSELRPDRFKRVAARPVAGDRAGRVVSGRFAATSYPGDFTRMRILVGMNGA
jgi:hypothetical protein